MCCLMVFYSNAKIQLFLCNPIDMLVFSNFTFFFGFQNQTSFSNVDVEFVAIAVETIHRTFEYA